MNQPVAPAITRQQDLQRGADNLLLRHMGLKAGDTCLLVLEPDESLYEKQVGTILASRSRALGANVTVVEEPLIADAAEFPSSVANLMRQVDHTLFLSRLGDYVRFVALPGDGTKTTSYTYNTDLLAAPYAQIPSNLMAMLRDKLEAELMAASNWHITCPLGTDLAGSFCWRSLAGGEDDELLVTLFPVSTFKPIPCQNANGRVALSRWLMPGGAAKLDCAGMDIPNTVFCDIQQGSIQSFSGCAVSARQVSDHYDRVASTLGINRNRVHSWHLGINPQTFFPVNANDDLDRWCAISFGSPRYLHFHTCGDEPPGEVAWSLFNCTVTVDDQVFWHEGEFSWLQRKDNQALIAQYPDADILLKPSCCIGV